jgi:hypothetical protein
MPLGDWQFWLVTALAVTAAWLVIRPLLPQRRKRGTRVDLTVGRTDEDT